ncbi:GIY-YIG nuclease family protein [Pandoraea pnomenusa]|uniref:GIY-YIG nuclease family protein n=1 Tax=Pandoraea pnomenusa TaxID=93220 RepID=UPI0012DA444A|nr:GIY-YIG nuclease family protein [Pandoraea pnomenusa]
MGKREDRKRISTASGRGQFEYSGDAETGIEIFFGDQQQFSARVSPEMIRALRAEFLSRPGPVLVGTSFDAPPLGSIGDWMLSRQHQNLACYLIPILEHLGEGEYDKRRRRFSFTKPDAEGKEDTPDTKASTMLTESFDGGSLATEAGNMMSRVAAEVTKLALSPVRRIECSLHDIANAEALGSRLGEWNLPAEGEFVVYRFQTEAPIEFHAAFPESAARTYKLSRKNELTDDGDTLYVGSSRNFASRLQQHFGFGFEGTYALHLKRWVPETLCHTPLVLEYWTVRDSKQVRPIVLQTLEDYLWDHSQPVFGRRGSK